ncbi:class I SAM-dependent methyltransferase [Roseobacter weihaiensis]|uniref:class I SAM-dependent methyltransferase n=1 Tax=Roseobacter weihaiensis TaxID=2763262 RepID=UPI001D0A20A6|nr:methyltransferase domain-containing protein [Roseobacter sp. H9]
MDWDEMARPRLATAPDLKAAFQEVYAAIFEAANLRPGERVLDVGCGTGPTLTAASEAVGTEGHVVGIDIVPPLLAAAAKRTSGAVELIVGDAGAYDFEAARFDAIIANFGIMFFQDNAAAFANLRKAVRPGGRLIATVWGPPQQNPWFSMPRRCVDQVIADVPRPDLTGPGPMRFGTPEGLIEALTSTGWAPEVEPMDLLLHPPGPAERVTDLHMTLTVPMMLKGVEVTDDQLDAVRQLLLTASSADEQGNDVSVPAHIHVVTATAL